MNNNVALIPARSGSKRVKNKNIRILKNHPLIAYSIYHAKVTNYFDRIIVSTDSEEIADVAKKYGAEVPYLRAKELSEDFSVDFDWIIDLIDKLKIDGETTLAILRPTNPIRDVKNLVNAIEFFNANKNFDSLRAMKPVNQHPQKMWKINHETFLATPILNQGENLPQFHSRPTQSLDEIYCQDASLELTTVKSLKLNKSISGEKVIGWVNSDFYGFDINTEIDLMFLEFLIEKNILELPDLDNS